MCQTLAVLSQLIVHRLDQCLQLPRVLVSEAPRGAPVMIKDRNLERISLTFCFEERPKKGKPLDGDCLVFWSFSSLTPYFRLTVECNLVMLFVYGIRYRFLELSDQVLANFVFVFKSKRGAERRSNDD